MWPSPKCGSTKSTPDGFAIDVVGPGDTHLLPGAQQVFLLDLRADVVRAPRAAVAEAGIQRPHVACAHDEIDHPVVVPDWLDLRAVQVTVGAQQALRFIDHARAIRLAGFEEELVANRLLAGLDMELVGRAVQPCTLARDTGIEDVADGDPDLADHRTVGLQLLGRGQGGTRTGSGCVEIASAAVCAATVSGASTRAADVRAAGSVRCQYAVRARWPMTAG